MELNKRNTFYLMILIFIYFLINTITQYVVSPTADLDQAEQLLLSQKFMLGYGPQPPLYTYIVKTIFIFTGPNLLILLILKAILLTILLGTIILIGVRLNFSIYQNLISVVSFAFIPQFIWESQRDLTHSVLATSLSALTLLKIIDAQRKPTLSNYIQIGVIFGFGLISKYNYAIFLIIIIISAYITDIYKSVLKHKYIIVSILIAIAISAPHYVWVLNNLDLASQSYHKLQTNSGNRIIAIFKVYISAIAFLTPLWLLSLPLLLKTSKIHYIEKLKTYDGKFLINLISVTFTIVTLFVLITNSHKMKDRWYQPILFYLPIIISFFTKFDSQKYFKFYIKLGLIASLIVSIALPSRTIFAEKFNKYSRPNIPFLSIFDNISKSIDNPDFIVSDSNLIAGNARLLFKNSKAITPSLSFTFDKIYGKILIICESTNCNDERLRKWSKEKLNINLSNLVYKSLDKDYYYTTSKRYKVYWCLLQ